MQKQFGNAKKEASITVIVVELFGHCLYDELRNLFISPKFQQKNYDSTLKSGGSSIRDGQESWAQLLSAIHATEKSNIETLGKKSITETLA